MSAPQVSESGRFEPRAVWRIGPWLAVIVGCSVLIVMAEISGLLSRLQQTGAETYSAGALTGWPGSPFWAGRKLTEAVTYWSAATEAGDPRSKVLSWLLWYMKLDVVFVLACAALLWFAVRAVGYEIWKAWSAALLLTVAGLAEIWAAYYVVGDLSGPPNRALAGVAGTLSAIKWVVAGLTLGAILLRWLSPRAKPDPPGGGDRIVRRHRVQVVVVSILLLVLVAPLGGGLDQGPDVVRAWADGECTSLATPFGAWCVNFPLQKVAGPAVGMLLLCAALWLAGRWALLDGAGPAPWCHQCVNSDVTWRGSLLPRKPRSGRRVPPQNYVYAAAIVAILVFAGRLALDMTLNLLAVAFILLVIGAVSLWFTLVPAPANWMKPRHGGRSRLAERVKPWQVDRPGTRRETVAYVGRCLAVAPIVAVGLLLIRAFSGPLLLNVPTRSASTSESRTWLVVGIVLAVLVAPGTAFALIQVEKRWLVATGDRGGRRTNAMGVAIIVLTILVAVWAAIYPATAGRGLRVIGLLTFSLAGVTIALGAVQRRVELRPPALVFNRLDRTPVFALGFVTLLLATLLDGGRYHDVAVTTTGTGEPRPAATLDQAFQAWLTAIDSCKPSTDAADGGHPVVPLVLVAAPGGGIRAAYWTAAALEKLAPPVSPCGDRPIFAISGVSGGSVGAALWAAQRRTGSAETSLNPARDMSKEEPLAALLAAMLDRDIPRMVHGVNGTRHRRIADRARVFEEAWESVHTPLRGDMTDAAPPARATNVPDWRPLLLLNGTAAEIGCRVIVSPIPAAVTHRTDGSATSCMAAAGTAALDEQKNVEVDPARFAPGALDARDYLGSDGRRDGQCDQPPGAALRLSTAALLSARFPYITPTGDLVFCEKEKNGQIKPVRTFDVDGGYLENNGIALALDLWRALEPMVAKHNGSALSTAQPLVAPMLAVLDNHYQSVAAVAPPSRPHELNAPVNAFLAPRKAQTDPVLLQEAFLSFSGTLPGLPSGRLRVGETVCAGTRVFRAAPNKHPGVEAPLGWVLSEWAQADLNNALDSQAKAADSCAPGAPDLVRPDGIATILRMLDGPLNFETAATSKP